VRASAAPPVPTPPLEAAPDPWVRLLLAEPELGAGIAAEERETAERIVIARTLTLPGGRWDGEARGAVAAFAAVVLDGLLCRECSLAGRRSVNLLGAGDVLPLGTGRAEDQVGDLGWRAATETRIAVLDRRFIAAIARWPWLAADIVRRAAGWADRAAGLQAISHLPSVEDRIVALLWHLADRWGRVVPDGVVVPLTLSHAALGELVGARRPTVSLALTALRSRGIVRPLDGGWLVDAGARRLLDRRGPASAIGRASSCP
jgi:CRP-like cAMP-binding protein